MRTNFGVMIAALFTVLLSSVGHAATSRTIHGAAVRGVAADQSSLSVADGDTVVVISAGKDYRQRLETLRAGDRVTLRVTEEPGTSTGKPAPVQTVLADIAAANVLQTTVKSRVVVLLGVLGALLLVAGLVLRSRVHMLVVGQDGRYSNSKVQMAIWFAVLVVTYVAVLWIRASAGGVGSLGGVSLPQNLLLLTGISALTFGASKGITVRIVEDARRDAAKRAQAQGINSQVAVDEAARRAKPPAGTDGSSDRHLISNLVTDDYDRPDLGDLQMLLLTLLAVGVYLARAFAFLGSMDELQLITLPDVDTTTLAAFGLGHGAYLTKKFAGKDGA